MEVEEQERGLCLQDLLLSTTPTEEPFSFQALARLRALIVNPSTPDSVLSSILQTLTRSLRLSPGPTSLSLFADLSGRLAFPPVLNALVSTAPPRLASEALDVLALMAERDAAPCEIGDGAVFAALCFGASSSVRLWLLRNADRFSLSPYLKLTVFLGFTNDPYPCVRRVALDGLASISESGAICDEEMIRGCYFRAVELLRDMDDCVRLVAIRAVCAWGLLSASNSEAKAQCSDELFVKLCSMARDMSVKVRVETFIALGKVQMVSEDILLQTLSKRVLGMVKEKRSLGLCCNEQFERAVSNVAGAILHGLEDEYCEVRKFACHSLSTLIILSARFSLEALDLLMDILNDDSFIVRLQALETMRHMAACDCLNVQEKHMHLFLGPLGDKNTSIRNAARNILKIVKLSVLELFKLTVDALLQNLARYPEDEVDAFSVLFLIGRNHGKFVVCIINDITQQIEPTCEGKLDFDNIRVAALIVLAISAPFLGEIACTIPPAIYSYAVTMLGRIANALGDVMDRSSLLSNLVLCSRSTRISISEFNEWNQKVLLSKGVNFQHCSNDDILMSGVIPIQQKIDAISKTEFSEIKDSREIETSVLANKLEDHNEVIKSMNDILAKVLYVWPFVRSGNIYEVLRILRGCKEELSNFGLTSFASAGVVTFTFQYLQIIELLSRVWEHFQPLKFLSHGMGSLDILLRKLDRILRELRSRFTGLSRKEELHVLELILVVCILRLSKIEICCKNFTLRRMTKALSRVEALVKEEPIELSEFMTEVVKSTSKIQASIFESSCDPDSLKQFQLKRLVELFCLKQFVFCGRLEHIKAELDVQDNDFENPLCFVPGLPVGISCSMALHNVSVESRLWLKMTMDDDGSTQFVFLELSLAEDHNGCRIFSFCAPFYRTPKALSFSIRLCIGIECPFEDLHLIKNGRGPKQELAYLCEEREVFLALNCKG